MKLTPRQSQIVELLAQGNTAEQTAESMHRSVGTVRRHVVLACQRTRARNTAHLIAMSISRGWISPIALALIIAAGAHQQPAYRVRQPAPPAVRIARQEVAA